MNELTIPQGRIRYRDEGSGFDRNATVFRELSSGYDLMAD